MSYIAPVQGILYGISHCFRMHPLNHKNLTGKNHCLIPNNIPLQHKFNRGHKTMFC